MSILREKTWLQNGSKTNLQVLLAALKANSRSGNLERAKQIHAEAVQCGYDCNIYVVNSLINMYARCESMMDASKVFEDMSHPTVVSWTTLILGYADNGQGYTALDMFTRMRSEGPAPNSLTFLAALKACASLAGKGADRWAECKAKRVHNIALEMGCNSDAYVQNCLIDLHAKCGSMLDAREVFDGMKHPTVVSWNVLILGYAENGQGHTALEMFTRMRKEDPAPNSATLVAALKACTSLAVNEGARKWIECRNRGKEIHSFAVQTGWDSDICVQSTLVDLYSKCGKMVDAREVFDGVKHPNVVSWTALILGYVDNGDGHSALSMFTRMKIEGHAPNLVTLGAVLKACGLVGALEFGRTIHSAIDHESNFTVVLVNCLVDFYAKCGCLVEAQRVFDFHAKTRDVITWTALLAGFSGCGDNEAVFGLFQGMLDAGLRPDGITLLCILTCCSHASLVVEGKEFFDTMFTKYGVVPTVEHYTCMIDLLGRANKLDDAMALLKCMPCSPNVVTWRTILGACRKWKNVEIGRLAFQSLIDLNGKDATAYLLMGQIYGSKGMLQEQMMVTRLRKKKKAYNIMPEETCWTNETGEVHRFLAEDNRHPQIPEICDKWRSMSMVMRHLDIADAEREDGLCGHSERFALICALINTDPGKTIRIVKNMKVCDNCHSASALVSKIESRTIVCRDANRVHVFKDGNCSCGDCW